MPYCDACARHWTPTSMRADGSCPTCGQVLPVRRPVRPAVTPPQPAGEGEEEGSRSKAPWHFKVLLLVLVVYLAWRGVQGVEWVAHHI